MLRAICREVNGVQDSCSLRFPPAISSVGLDELTSVAPPALNFSLHFYPALAGWANLCRALQRSILSSFLTQAWKCWAKIFSPQGYTTVSSFEFQNQRPVASYLLSVNNYR